VRSYNLYTVLGNTQSLANYLLIAKTKNDEMRRLK